MLSEDSTKKRLLWADLVRVVAISLVVLIHSFTLNQSHSLSNQISIYLFTFAKTCVPLFLMLSGALLLPKKENYLTYFKKRVNRLVRPWMVWTVVLYLLTYGLVLYSPLTMARNYVSLFSAGFTYLPMITFLYLFIPGLRVFVRYGKKVDILYIILIWWVSVSLLPYFRNSLAFPMHVDNGLVRQSIQYGGYLLLGYVLTQIKLSRKQLLSVGITVLVSLVVSAQLLTRNSELDFDYLSYSAPFIIIESAGLFLILKHSEKILSSLSDHWKKTLLVLSQISYGVFLIHTILILQLIKIKELLNFGPLGNNLIFYWIVILASGLIIWGLTQIKRVKRWVT